MFQEASSKIRNTIYGIMGCSQLGTQVNCSNGTGFMIAPGVLVTAAHLVHGGNNFANPIHSQFEVIRAPEVGQQMEHAQLVAQDQVRDIALLRIDDSRSNLCVSLESDIIPIGTSCGSLGFPLASVEFAKTGRTFHLVQRFQGANISAFHTQADPSGRQLSYYETDALMYKGPSGCPGFLANANVFGMHIRSVVERPRTQQGMPPSGQTQPGTRLAISLWVPSMDIITFATENGVMAPQYPSKWWQRIVKAITGFLKL